MCKIFEINAENAAEAGRIHSVSWQESHKSFCTPEFIALHSPERQAGYLIKKLNGGTRIWMLTDGKPVGIVSVTDSLIEDLYILPDEQNKGYGTKLLDFAIENAGEKPTLWILENNKRAEKLYRRRGFYPTGQVNAITDKLNEIEFVLAYDIRRNRLKIPGMTRNFTLLHISDSHLCVTDSETDAKEAAYIAQRENFWQTGKCGFARYFGGRLHDGIEVLSTADAFERLLEYAKAVGADEILSSGDLLECMHEAGERFVKTAVGNIGINFTATPGNHEEAVCNGIWEEDIRVSEHGCFRIAAIDNRKKTFTDNALNRLESLCRDGLPIILAMHIPLMTDKNRPSILGKREEYYTIDENNCDANCKRFYEIIRRYDAVKLILCGHIHGYCDTEPIENIRQITAPQGMVCGCHLLTVHG